MLLILAFPALLTLASAAPCPAEVQSRFDNFDRSLKDVERALNDIGSRAVRVRIRRKLETVSRRTAEARSEAC
ncbi:MAG: hypothetical protein GY822_26705 [Deltaproteobacteria bacterium]|nr:hypothetical protein [Deltaproteobacteria bacterium]